MTGPAAAQVAPGGAVRRRNTADDKCNGSYRCEGPDGGERARHGASR